MFDPKGYLSGQDTTKSAGRATLGLRLSQIQMRGWPPSPVDEDQEHNALRGPADALALGGSHQTYLRR